MSGKMKDDITKESDKMVVKKNISPKKVTNKTKTETKKTQVDKKNGKIFTNKGIQTDQEEKVTADDLTSQGKLFYKILY